MRFTDRFVRELPGDPRAENRTRQVLNACYSRVEPTAVAKPELLVVVPEVAQLLDLDPAAITADVLAGNAIAPGMVPYAACYGGHQFGSWAGQLGDGRAITLGEVENADGETWEMQLKGAGPTPYSRRADGRAVLRSSLRELVCSEAMHHLGVPTTRALSLALTGDSVVRDLLYDGHPAHEPGAIVCRVAPSFLRFGSYEIHASRDDLDTLRRLVQFTIDRYYPHVADVAGLFAEVAHKTAFLVAEWMRVGFVHGVMNTDNMSILGLTIDYGPYGWLEPFDLDWTPNITDAQGRRYRFGNQPSVAHWNVAQLGRALVRIVDDPAPLQRTLERFPAQFGDFHRHATLRKLGLVGHRARTADDDALLASLGELLVSAEIDTTLFFRCLARGANTEDLLPAYYAPPTNTDLLDAWLLQYRFRVAAERITDAERRARIEASAPLYVPRNYLLQEVIDKTAAGDRAALPELVDVLRRPYDDQGPARAAFAAKRPDWARDRPGCSMLSCSS